MRGQIAFVGVGCGVFPTTLRGRIAGIIRPNYAPGASGHIDDLIRDVARRFPCFLENERRAGRRPDTANGSFGFRSSVTQLLETCSSTAALGGPDPWSRWQNYFRGPTDAAANIAGLAPLTGRPEDSPIAENILLPGRACTAAFAEHGFACDGHAAPDSIDAPAARVNRGPFGIMNRPRRWVSFLRGPSLPDQPGGPI